MLKKIAIGIVLLLGVLMLLATTKPATFAVERSATINAPPDSIFVRVNDFHRWAEWSPWEKLDTNMTRTFSGAAAGPGAIYEWEGNSDVGKGRMEITDATAPGKVSIKLDFLSPIEAHNTTVFSMQPSGSATNVTWMMSGDNNFMAKVMSVFVSMDQLIGKDFESGLANMKAAAEK